MLHSCSGRGHVRQAVLGACLLLALFVPPHAALGSWATCEKIDGDCPACQKLDFLSPTATVSLSGEPELVQSANAADSVLRSLGPVTEFDNTQHGLHTSIFYFCCHSLTEQNKMKAALQSML